MEVNLTTLLILSLATWRLSSLISNEDGPGEIFAKLRKFIGVYYDEFSVAHGKNIIAQAVTCVWCLSVWIAGVVVILAYLRIFWPVLLILAASGGAILIDKLIDHE